MATISVNQPDGEIVLTRDGGPSRTYPVTNGLTTVADDEVEHFLRVVPGATPADVTKKTSTQATSASTS